MTTENKTAAPKVGHAEASPKTSPQSAKVAPSVSAPGAAKIEVKKDAPAPAPSANQKK